MISEREKLGCDQTLFSEMKITDKEYFFRSVRTKIGSFGLAALAVDIVLHYICIHKGAKGISNSGALPWHKRHHTVFS